MVSKKNLLIILFFFISLIIAMFIHSEISFQMQHTYKTYPYIFLIGIPYIPVGIILGILSCQERFRIKGKLKFNTLYFLIMFVPSLFLYFYFFINYLPFGKLPSFFAVPYMNTKLYPLYGLLMGYCLITSFYKVKDKPTESNGDFS